MNVQDFILLGELKSQIGQCTHLLGEDLCNEWRAKVDEVISDLT